MGEAYSVYWSRARWIRATAACDRLAVLFGGPHTSLPSFRRATVQPGDLPGQPACPFPPYQRSPPPDLNMDPLF